MRKVPRKKKDLQALHLSRTYLHKTSTEPPSCGKPRQPTIKMSHLYVPKGLHLSPKNYHNCKCEEQIQYNDSLVDVATSDNKIVTNPIAVVNLIKPILASITSKMDSTS